MQHQVGGAVGAWCFCRVSLHNKHGLHLRPAQRIVETASSFQADVRATKDHLDMNAKSIVDMIEFAAYMVNKVAYDDAEFQFEALGDDAKEALDALNRLIDEGFGLD